MKSEVLVVCLLFLVHSVLGRQGFGPTEQEWGYVSVREYAHMFWWLHETAANVQNPTDKPLVVWLQGGPGGSSTGYGNFAELGPLDLDLKPRNFTWLNDYNVLFVDNPVGTGFSYVERLSALTITNRQIAEDFVVLLQGFYKALPEYKTTPLYIFSESYGGKMTIEIALVLDQAIKKGELDINFIGVGLGDSWISPIDSVLTWGPYLLNLGIIDENGYDAIQAIAEETKGLVESEQWEDATTSWATAEYVVERFSNNIDFYNVLKKIHSASNWKLSPYRLIKPDEDDVKLNNIMPQVREALKLEKVWGAQSSAVFNYLWEDFMKPVTDIVEAVLNTTNIKVAVFNGHLDLIVDTPGTIKWVDNLKFDGSPIWKTTQRYSLVVDSIIEGYYKKLGNLAMYWVDRAGHMVPADNPAAMDYILRDISK